MSAAASKALGRDASETRSRSRSPDRGRQGRQYAVRSAHPGGIPGQRYPWCPSRVPAGLGHQAATPPAPCGLTRAQEGTGEPQLGGAWLAAGSWLQSTAHRAAPATLRRGSEDRSEPLIHLRVTPPSHSAVGTPGSRPEACRSPRSPVQSADSARLGSSACALLRPPQQLPPPPSHHEF